MCLSLFGFCGCSLLYAKVNRCLGTFYTQYCSGHENVERLDQNVHTDSTRAGHRPLVYNVQERRAVLPLDSLNLLDLWT